MGHVINCDKDTETDRETAKWTNDDMQQTEQTIKERLREK